MNSKLDSSNAAIDTAPNSTTTAVEKRKVLDPIVNDKLGENLNRIAGLMAEIHDELVTINAVFEEQMEIAVDRVHMVESFAAVNGSPAKGWRNDAKAEYRHAREQVVQAEKDIRDRLAALRRKQLAALKDVRKAVKDIIRQQDNRDKTAKKNAKSK